MRKRWLLIVMSATILLSCAPQKSSQPGHYEVITYQLNNGIAARDYLAINSKVEHFLIAQPGFLNRGIGQINDSVWIDVLTWRTKSDFEKAFEKSASDEAIIAMTKMINEATYQIFSFESASLNQ